MFFKGKQEEKQHALLFCIVQLRLKEHIKTTMTLGQSC